MAGFLRRLFAQAFPPSRNPAAPVEGTPESVLYDAAGMLSPVAAAYTRRLDQCGPTPRGVFWSSQDNVRRRFDFLCRVFDPADIAQGGVTVRDFGCGYGALWDYLKDHPILQDGAYVGYDITQSMLDACMRRIRDPRASFRRSARPQTPADYTLVSGTFNMKLQAADEAWLDYVEASLHVLWETTGTALAFNMLDLRYKDDQMDGLYYADKDVVARFCRDTLSDDLQVFENYGLPDFTVLVRRR